MRLPAPLLATLLALVLGGCASAFPHREVKQSASVVDYLYPKAEKAPQVEQGVAYLRPPVRVGIAFVPAGPRARALPETERLKLMERVRASFAGHEYIGAIEIIPTQYLQPGGGFGNLEQVARMFHVEVMALVSHDQVQFNDSNSLAVLYWTIVGAYVIHGDEYDVQTMVDVSVFDVASHRLLFRAPGTSQVKGAASLATFSERSRAAQTEGYVRAVDQLVPQLQSELDRFRERVKTDSAIRVEHRAGYRGGGSADGFLLAWVGLLAAFGGYLRRRA
jgi:rhombotail lipoprotein